MRIDEMLQLVFGGLEGYATKNKARLIVSRDPFDILEQLFAGPRGLLIVLNYAGGSREDDGLSETESGCAQAREQIDVVVGTGCTLDPGRDGALLFGSADRAGLLQRVSEVRAAVLSFVFPNDGESLPRLAYEGCEPVTTPQGFPLAAYRLKFSLLTAVETDKDTELS